MIDGNAFDMSNAPKYRRVGDVLVFPLVGPVQVVKSWGIQQMGAGDVIIVNPGSAETSSFAETYGCEGQAFRDTYEPVPGKPGWYRKKTFILALQMEEPFQVVTLDNPDPYGAPAGWWLVQNIRPNGELSDRYFIDPAKFVNLYEIV